MRDFLVTWAVLLFGLLYMVFLGAIIVGNVLLSIYAVHEHPLWLWWTIPVNILSFTGIMAWLLYRDEN